MDKRSNLRSLLDLYRLRCIRDAKAHLLSAIEAQRLDVILTTVNVILSIGVVSLSSSYWIVNLETRVLGIFINIFGISVVITATLQYIFDFRTRRENHHRHYVDYSALNKDLELKIVECSFTEESISEFKGRFQKIVDTAPIVPNRIWSILRELSDAIDLKENALRREPPA